MSYTLNYTGSEIDDILARAVPGGALDTAIAAKQDALTFDAVPTEGSTNPVESGGIYDAIQAGGAAALAAFPTDTVSGDVVSFPDGADGIPVKSFVGSIAPQQNLNGQSAPYPAGGGKNKLPMVLADIKAANTSGTWSGNAYTIVGVTFTVLTDSVGNVTGIATSGTASATASIMIPASGITDGMILTGCPSGGSASTYQIVAGTSDARSATDNGTGATISGATDRVIMRVYSGTNVTGKTFYPMIRLSSVTDATFAPYSNICPISGWAGAEITRTGRNLWGGLALGQLIYTGEVVNPSSNDWYSPRINVGDNTKLTLAIYDLSTYTSGSIGYYAYDANGRGVGSANIVGNTSAITAPYTATVTIPSGAAYLRLRGYKSGGASGILTMQAQAEFGSTATAYEAYQGETRWINFGVNQWDEVWEQGALSTGGASVANANCIRSTNYIPVDPSTTYHLHIGKATQNRILFYNSSKAVISYTTSSNYSRDFTTPADCAYIRFCTLADTSPYYGGTYNHDIFISDYFVYGGTITALGGGLWSVQPTHAVVDMGSLSWTYDSVNTRFWSDGVASEIVKPATWGANALCSMFGGATGNPPNGRFSIYASGRLYVKDTQYTTEAAFTTAVTGQTFLYQLATLPAPITITGEDLQTLLGANTIWTDVGSVTGMTYRADTALYIQKLLNGGGTLSLSMASPSPSLSLGRVGVLAEPEEAEPEQTDEEAEQLEQTEESERTEEA